jgi:outer membrane usher protein FimD/PapC
VDGVNTLSDRTFKIEGVFDGELLDVPNLIFTPSLDISFERDITNNTDSNVYDLELDFVYEFVLPRNVSWELETTYNWNQDEGEMTRELDLGSDFVVDLITPTWDFNFEQNASTTISYDNIEPTSWDNDFTFGASRELTPRIFFDVAYQYQYSGDSENSDEFETNLEWHGRNSSLAFTFSKERTFEGPKDVVRTYEAEFTLEF